MRGLYSPKELSERFGYASLEGQFLLCREKDSAPRGWFSNQIGAWSIGTHPLLPTAKIVDRSGDQVGLLLGAVIRPRHGFVGPYWQLPISRKQRDFANRFEDLLYGCFGTFAAIVACEAVQRVYLDPSGSLSMVFCPSKKVAASTPMLIPYDSTTEDNIALIRAMGIPRRNTWYPFGLTPRFGIQRLLPNHFLDLIHWTPVRHWPTESVKRGTQVDDSIEEIAGLLTECLFAVTEGYRPWLSLTAGRDSRILLACARDFVDRINFVTFDLFDTQAKLDCEVAGLLAEHFQLNHRKFEASRADEDELAEWMYRIGCSANAMRGWKGLRAFNQLGRDAPYLPGVPGEFRALYWKTTDEAETPLPATELLARMNLPRVPATVSAGERWLSELPVSDTFSILDFAYIEQRVGCWLSVSATYANPNAGRFRVFPFSHRRIFERMLELPAQYQRDRGVAPDLIGARWPELLHVPFNTPLTWSGRARSTFGRLMRTPQQVFRRLMN